MVICKFCLCCKYQSLNNNGLTNIQFREAGNVPLSELLRREEEETNKALPAIAAKPVERKNKGLSIRAPSFFTKKKPVATKIVQKVERNEEEKEEE